MNLQQEKQNWKDDKDWIHNFERQAIVLNVLLSQNKHRRAIWMCEHTTVMCLEKNVENVAYSIDHVHSFSKRRPDIYSYSMSGHKTPWCFWVKRKRGGCCECTEQDNELDTVHIAFRANWQCGRNAHRPHTCRCLRCHQFFDVLQTGGGTAHVEPDWPTVSCCGTPGLSPQVMSVVFLGFQGQA